MKIILKDSYKSLEPFVSDDLYDLTVITGKNGSGKSQLLDLIDKKSKKDGSVVGIELIFDPAILKVQAEGVAKLNISTVNIQIWKEILTKQLNILKSLGPEGTKLLSYYIENKAKFQDVDFGATFISQDTQYKDLIVKRLLTQNWSNIDVDNISANHQLHALNSIPITNTSFINLISELLIINKKNLKDLSDADFFSSSISDHIIDESELFNSQIELIFYNYAKRRDKNRRAYFDKIQDQKTGEGIIDSISDADFIAKNTPPWILINQILERNKIDFYFKEIIKEVFESEMDLDFQLIKKSIEKKIDFNDLSSGEKIIIGLILKLFASEYYGENLSFPELIILDEPDAHLHPEMSKLLIDVLEHTFVNKFKIKTIITTHSPSTIALCPENNIYQLSNGYNSSLKKISKDEALKLLTDFIPTLSIDYKSHKQIFVESPTDVAYFQNLSDKHLQDVKLAHKLYFISNSAGKGNCSQVYKIVNELRDSGNKTSYGIVDWDLNNESTDHVFVHGLNSRYSVENYLLDPVYITILLIDLNNAHNTLEKVGLDKTVNQYSLGNKSDQDLQTIVKGYFKDFEDKFPSFKYDSEHTQINYLNNRKLNIPVWYLREQGHSLVTKLKQIYPALSKYSNEGEVQKKLSIVCAKCYPFVPSDSIEIIESLGIKL